MEDDREAERKEGEGRVICERGIEKERKGEGEDLNYNYIKISLYI